MRLCPPLAQPPTSSAHRSPPRVTQETGDTYTGRLNPRTGGLYPGTKMDGGPHSAPAVRTCAALFVPGGGDPSAGRQKGAALPQALALRLLQPTAFPGHCTPRLQLLLPCYGSTGCPPQQTPQSIFHPPL